MSSTANTFTSLQPLMKEVYPSKEEKKKRFRKIKQIFKKD